MATEQQKTAMLESLHARIESAERAGLTSTAKSWRDTYATIANKPAADIICAVKMGSDHHA